MRKKVAITRVRLDALFQSGATWNHINEGLQ
jgi:hypothetical protein